MIYDGNVDYKGVLLASSASISSINAVNAVSAGASSITSGNMVLSNSNNISFGLNAGTVTASIANQGLFASQYPMPGYFGLFTQSNNLGATGNTGGEFQTTASFFIHPMNLPYNLSYNQVAFAFSLSISAGTGSNSEGYLYGLYTLNGGTRFDLVTSYIFNYRFSQNSDTSQAIYWYWGTNSTSNSSSSEGNISVNYSGTMNGLLETNAGSSLAASEYYLAYGYTYRSANAIVGRINRGCLFSGTNTILGRVIGETSSIALHPYMGNFTTTSNATTTGQLVMPGTINTSVITNIGGSGQWRNGYILFRSN